MTRDEALKIWTLPEGHFSTEGEIIDRFVALGMLKLDEPKKKYNPYEGARHIFRNRFGDQVAADLLAALHACGIELTAKG